MSSALFRARSGQTAVNVDEDGPYPVVNGMVYLPAALAAALGLRPAAELVTLPVTLLEAVRVLTDDEIKGLPSTPVDIIPAPGSGKLILPLSGLLIPSGWSTGVRAYTGAAGQLIGTGLFGPDGPTHRDVKAIFEDGHIGYLNPQYSETPAESGLLATYADAIANLINAPVQLLIDGGSNLGGGSPSNGLIVRIVYRLVTL
jgi:hypothetical protein